ncbi:hypothetical protein [Sphingomonas elodea]|uniref:hypothetical protein n=1 Tax=Sphingomonas elodea TaxID=179878 RepID=UPI0002631AC8|nr:hypothetical protein [Sphingomonas elodea]
MAKLGTVWERATEFVGERIRMLAPLALAAFVVPNVVSAWCQAQSAVAAPGMQLVLFLPVLLLSIVSMGGSLAVIALATGEGTLGGATRLAVRRLPAALLVSILMGIAAAILGVPVLLILAARGYDVMVMATGQGANVVVDPQTSSIVALYALVVVILLCVAVSRLILASAVVLREGVALASLRRSWRLTAGHGWRIFGTLLLFVVIAGIAQLAARTVFGSVFALLFGAGEGMTAAFLLTALVTSCVQAVAMLLLAAFQGKLYAERVDEMAGAA